MIFYISDLHFGHENIIPMCNRPFSSVEEMEKILISNWNNVVSKNDTVYILGDLSYRNKESIKPILKQLNGTKHLIIGNHDHLWMKNIELDDYFASVNYYLEIFDNNTEVILFHFPLMTWNRQKNNTIHVHGHIHNNTAFSGLAFLKPIDAYNAGVEINNYTPVTIEQLKKNKELFYNSLLI